MAHFPLSLLFPFRFSAEMFVTVLHGENRADIFNIHCEVQRLLDGIKRRCGCEDEDDIELADESGQVKNLLQNKQRSATELLGEREAYVLLGVTRGERPSMRVFTPLLKDESVINAKFLGLRNHSPHGSRTRTPVASPKQSRKL
ncbi:uncharacterized protein CXorf65 homolog isoform X4 [Lacerta agilis]|uniref:uncharacterized protein CXorf65 homolog isoform X4 n=1 Tax=Lacerta agilis TaxID=80427 RepID=UPI00141A1AC4|nr:uncharacterized protein CXorf65 homolog isoform X4 [Lacerta agilis]